MRTPYQLFCQDCVEGMAQLPAASIPLVIADPPYNIGMPYDLHDDRMDDQSYLDWSRRWLTAVVRILAPDGAFWLVIGDEYAAELKVMIHRELGLHLRNWIIWHYTFGQNCTRKFNRAHAHLLYFVRDPKHFTFHADAIKVPSARQRIYADKRAARGGKCPDDVWVLRPQETDDAFQPDQDVWYVPRVCGTYRERLPEAVCQLPEALVERIILACSSVGQTVLDPFAGSGTTLAVAVKHRRQAIGYEISPRLIEAIHRRLQPVAV